MIAFTGIALAATGVNAATPAAPPLPAILLNATAASSQPDLAAARMIGGIIAYSRWPAPTNPVRMCVAGRASHASGFDEIEQSAGRPVRLQYIPTTTMPVACDVLYLGAMPPASRMRLIAATRNQPILSIIEQDPDCRSGAMICLDIGATAQTFRLSIDAVSRSKVRIDPRVLRIAGEVARP